MIEGVNYDGLQKIIDRHPHHCQIATSHANWLALHAAHEIAIENAPFQLRTIGEFVHKQFDHALLEHSEPAVFSEIPLDAVITVSLDLGTFIAAFTSLVVMTTVITRTNDTFEWYGTPADYTAPVRPPREMFITATASFREYLRTLDPEIPLVMERLFQQ